MTKESIIKMFFYIAGDSQNISSNEVLTVKLCQTQNTIVIMMIVGVFSYIGIDSICCFCIMVMVESMGMKTTARKGVLVDTLGNRTQGRYPDVPHAIH